MENEFQKLVPLKDYERVHAELTCIKSLLGLGPLHSAAWSVEALYNHGREEFERIRDLGVVAKSTERV